MPCRHNFHFQVDQGKKGRRKKEDGRYRFKVSEKEKRRKDRLGLSMVMDGMVWMVLMVLMVFNRVRYLRVKYLDN